MESIREQIEYGSYCKPHGTPLGTPGGADLMCGLCESGLTEWVDDPMYGLAFTYGDQDEWLTTDAAKRSHTSWWASDDPERVCQQIRHAVTPMREAVDSARDEGTVSEQQAAEFYRYHRWQAIKISDGYWAEPVPGEATR